MISFVTPPTGPLPSEELGGILLRVATIVITIWIQTSHTATQVEGIEPSRLATEGLHLSSVESSLGKPQVSRETPKSEETAVEFVFSAFCGLKSLQINLLQNIKVL